MSTFTAAEADSVAKNTASSASEIDSDEDEVPELVLDPTYNDKSIPVTILAGFLGSGKSTLLNHILTADHGLRIAVIENEFGEGLGIETMIAKSGVDGDNISNFFELGNGCICCTVKDDLLTTLEQLVMHKDRFDYIIIETAGLANPGPIVSTFWTDAELNTLLYLDGMVCVVDALNFESYLLNEELSSDVRTQLCFADRILLNKSDLVSADQMATTRRLVKEINSFAAVAESTFSRVAIDFVLNTNSYGDRSSSSESQADCSSDNFFLQCVPCAPVAATAVADVVETEEQHRTNAKGLAFLQLQSVDSNNSNSSSSSDRVSQPVKEKGSRITHAGTATAFMTTHYLKFEGKADLNALKSTLDSILYDNGQNNSNAHYTSRKNESSESSTTATQIEKQHPTGKIYRMKAVIHAADSDRLYILQAVHDIFDLQQSSYEVGGAGDQSNGNNLFVVIGKNIDAELIESRIRNCFR